MKQMTEEEKALTIEALSVLLNGGDVEYFDCGMWLAAKFVSSLYVHRPKPKPAATPERAPDDTSTTAGKIAVMQAEEAGAVMQCKSQNPNDTTWEGITARPITWDWRCLCYRPKPQPASRDWSGPDDVPQGPFRLRCTGGHIYYPQMIFRDGIVLHGSERSFVADWDAIIAYEYDTPGTLFRACRVTVTDGQAETGRDE